MKLDNNLLSPLKLDNIYFKEIYMTSTGEKVNNEGEANFNFHLEEPVIKDNSLSIELYCRIEIENIVILQLCMVGKFKADNEEFLKRMIPNAVAIIFPYLRSQVSLMTAQPNIPTIVMPPMNINSLLEGIKK